MTSPSARLSPNFFIAFRLNTTEFVSAVENLQGAIVHSHPHLKPCRTPARKMHITGLVMELSSPEEIERAKHCLETHCAEALRAPPEPLLPLTMPFGRLNTFSTKVLYVDPLESPELDTLRAMRGEIVGQFSLHCPELRIESSGDWVPHATVMKTSKLSPKQRSRVKLVKEELLQHEGLIQNLSVPVLGVELVSMREEDPATGFYKRYGDMRWG